MDIYNLKKLEIKTVIRVASEAKINERVYYGKNLRSHELIICLSGEGDVVFNNTKMIDKEGYVRFLPKGIYDADYYVVNKENGECIDIFFDSDTVIPQQPFNKNYNKNPNIINLFVKLNKLWVKKDTGYYNKCMSLLHSILFEMEATDNKYLPASHINKFSCAITYIHQHYCDNNFNYELLPKLCGISYTHFKNLFVKTYGSLPSEYVNNLKIKYACELLDTNRFSVSQISEKCGFNDVCYFSRQFKKNVGVSPSKYNKP